MLPTLQTKIAGMAKLAREKNIFPIMKRDGKKVRKVWVSPGDWKRMNPEKQAVVVALWHEYENYNDNFPFDRMVGKKSKKDGNTKFVDGGTEGLTFDFYGDDIKKAGLVSILKELKIPHTVELEKEDNYDGPEVATAKG